MNAERRRCDDPHCPLCAPTTPATTPTAVASPPPLPTAEAVEYVRAMKDCTPFIKQQQACDQAADALEQLQAAQAENQQLRDFIRSIEWYGIRCDQDITGCVDLLVCPECDRTPEEGHQPDCKLHAALGQDGQPARPQDERLDQLERFRQQVEDALKPGRWRGFDGPDGVSIDEVIGDIAIALRTLEQHAALGQVDQ